MRRLALMVAITAFAACSSEHPTTAPRESSFDRAANPKTVIDLLASYDMAVPQFYSDGRSVPDAPDIVTPFKYFVTLPPDRPHYDEDQCPVEAGYYEASNIWMGICVNGMDMPIRVSASCESRATAAGVSSGVLAAYVTAVPVDISFELFRYSLTSGSIVAWTRSEHVPFSSVPPRFQESIFGYLINVRSMPAGDHQLLGYLGRDKTTADIGNTTGLVQALSMLAPFLGDGSVLSDPAQLLALLKDQHLVDLVLKLSPVFNPTVHAAHPACRGPDETTTAAIQFAESANYVSAPSGNKHLLFDGGLNEPALHYNASQSMTQGIGSLLSDDALWTIDLSQLSGSVPVIDHIMSGVAVPARACPVASSSQCTDVKLVRK